ncbi:MAG: immunoglobulin domain-containing protein [Verrucomicrobia bacterium]|nr:immunoglobulin domain-containing protein [Verrucomicrobiota bacterium]
MKPFTFLATICLAWLDLFQANALTEISQHPADQVVSLNGTVTLEVTASTTAPPVTYQWHGQDTLLLDQTNRTLVLQNVTLDQAGEYYVVVNDADNQPVQSNPASVTVDPTFTRVTAGDIVTDQEGSVTGTWGDYDGNGFLDLYLANSSSSNVRNSLYRNNGDGTFRQLTAAEAGDAVLDGRLSAGAVAGDYDGDGDDDLWVGMEPANALYRNDGSGKFAQAASGSLAGDTLGTTANWVDYDNDGWFDLSVAGINRPIALHRNLAGQGFADVAAAAGLGVSIEAYDSAWGDYDNDGHIDFFVVNEYSRTNTLYRNNGDGTFAEVDVGSPIRDGTNDVGVNWVDIDNDGDLDLFIACGDGKPEANLLYLNKGNANHWLKINLTGQASNRSGVGAKIRVQATIRGQAVTQLRQITACGLGAGHSLIAHFGLGDATKADVVRVEWPSGNVQELSDVSADQLRTITEAVRITPVRPSASLGGSVTLTAQLNGTWQWYRDGAALDGQTAKTLTLSNIQAADAGRYSVVVDTATGTFTHHVYLLVDTQFERIEMGDTTESVACAWGDYNNDDYPDLLVVPGAKTSATPSWLYRNLKDGSLVKVSAVEAGDIVGLARQWWSPAWGDYDNDGYLDLFVSDGNPTSTPLAALWRNLGNGRFVEVTDTGSFASDWLWGNPIWGDFNRDGHLDLFVANAWYEPPELDVPNALYLSLGDGTFRKEAEGEIVTSRGQVQGGAAGDMDGDGDLDILLVGPQGAALFENDGAAGFQRIGFPAVPGYCAGPSWADYDNDGRLDVFVTVYDGAPTSQLLHNDGDAGWTTIPLGLTLQTYVASWADYDNDGDLDLFITRGFDTTTTNLFYANNGDGTFTQVTLGSLANHPGRSVGAAWADYDNNGFQDLFVTSHAGFPEVLYRNHGNGNHWISFKLVGTRSNRSAIGTKVRVQATIFGKTTWQMREISGGNYVQNDLRPHFGLGDAPRATTVRVQWPSGTVEEFSNLARDQFHTIVEPSLRGAMKSNGEFELSLWASTNRTCTIEHSNDLVTWIALTTFTGQGDNPVSYIDTAAPDRDHVYLMNEKVYTPRLGL